MLCLQVKVSQFQFPPTVTIFIGLIKEIGVEAKKTGLNATLPISSGARKSNSVWYR